jgi:hypothetical protein
MISITVMMVGLCQGYDARHVHGANSTAEETCCPPAHNRAFWMLQIMMQPEQLAA